MKLYAFVIVVVMLMAIYPVCELTRCIVEYNIIPLQAAQASGGTLMWGSTSLDFLAPGWVPTLEGFYLELALIWSGYICIPFVLAVAFKLAVAQGRYQVIGWRAR